ncbi:MAG: hypothetical protein KDL87_06570, partial [Verrucomicrobiae bacterium]|nr:hypothetical protein [Verrucomicrobiae bacterium]
MKPLIDLCRTKFRKPRVPAPRRKWGQYGLFFGSLLGCAIGGIVEAWSLEPTVTKVFGRGSDPAGNLFGASVAVSDRFLIVGEPSNDDAPPAQGAVNVFDAKTHRFLRKIVSPDTADGDQFGFSVALCGELLLVGAPLGDGIAADSGTAFLFELPSGRLLRRLIAGDGASGDNFGRSVSLNRKYALVGADQVMTGTGAAYLFETPTGFQLAKWVAAGGAPGDLFGYSVSLSGAIGAVGAPGADGGSPGSGAAYWFDTDETGTVNERANLFPADGATDDAFGTSIALDGWRTLIGAPGDDDSGPESGSAYVFFQASQVKKLRPVFGSNDRQFGAAVALSGNLAVVGVANASSFREEVFLFDAADPSRSELTEIRRFVAPDGSIDDGFGRSIAVCGSKAVVGALFNEQAGSTAGAAYCFQGLAAPFPAKSIAQRGDFAPRTVDARIGTFRGAWGNPAGASYTAALTGPGSNRNRDHGNWIADTVIGNPQFPSIVRRTDVGSLFGPGVAVAKVEGHLQNVYDLALSSVVLGGPGITSANSRAILGTPALAGPFEILRTGPTNRFGGTETFSRFLELTQSFANDLSVAYSLRIGTGGVGKANDSGVIQLDNGGMSTEIRAREGNVIPGAGFGGDSYGQFTGRVAQADSEEISVHSFFRLPAGGGTPIPQLVAQKAGQDPTDVATRGDMEPSGSGDTFLNFLSETTDLFGHAIFRATLTGPGATKANNE